MTGTVEDDALRIGDALRRWRLALNITAAIAAERAGISIPTLRSIETGNAHKSSFGAILSLARVYGIEKAVFDGFEPLNTDLGLARAYLMVRKRTS